MANNIRAEAKVCFDEGVRLFKQGLYEEATKAFKQTIMIKPYAVAYCNLGTAYIELNRYQEAVEAFKQAININPNDADARRWLDIVYSELRKSQQSTSQSNSTATSTSYSSDSSNKQEEQDNHTIRTVERHAPCPYCKGHVNQFIKHPTSSGGCFIATVYGSYGAHEVLVLRQWRDSSLSNTYIGQRFIKLYYRVSPGIASWIRDRLLIRMLIKKLLDVFIHTWLRNYR